MKGKKDQDARGGRIKTGDDGEVEVRQKKKKKKVVRRRWKDEEARKREERIESHWFTPGSRSRTILSLIGKRKNREREGARWREGTTIL